MSKRRDVSFEVGDWVFLKMRPYRQHTLFRRTSHKLSTRYYGPFHIETRISPVAYRLKLPEGTRVHSVFHVSLLKRRIVTDTPTSGTLPPLRANGFIQRTPERVLDFREIDHDGDKVREALVLWQGLTRDDATWEYVDQLRVSFPFLDLEDKVLLGGRSNELDIAPVQRTSNRQRIPNRKYGN